ncbi:MAG: hypothetical protein DCC59_06230 [Chloroflexi bacterium]|jgi:fucose 4-O-acetylase-like acetyltransferase|nr:MAG: hypothetical protein DCC59_06230 [Chloroflexota bacterium]
MAEEMHSLDRPLAKAVVAARRIDYIDIAKGIGIVLVVMGHNDFALISPFGHKLIYSFHMPMFFFMSGMFSKPDMSFWAFARRRFERVLRPFFFTILLIYFMTSSFSKVSISVATSRVFKAMYGNGHYLDWVQLWFLPHLFVVSLFAWFFIQAVRRSRLFNVRWVILVMIYVAGVLGIALFWPFEFNLLGKEYTIFGLPYSLDIVFVSGFFFLLGHELHKKRPDSLLENPLTLFISGFTLILLVWYFPSTIDLNTRQFDSLFINTGEALLGILFILTIAKQMERVGWLSSLFRYIGQASLVILIFQVPIQDYWGQKILALANNRPFSYWVSFLAGVIGPIVINALFIRPNPILREWFSQHVPQEEGRAAVSVFE